MGEWRPGRGTAGHPRAGSWPATKDRPVADAITQVGRFSKVKPKKPGKVWNRWKWAGLGFWATTVGGSIAYAAKKLGLPKPEPDPYPSRGAGRP